MPDKTNISILGAEFEVSTPFKEGHVCTEAEAKVLNQTRRENIGNNFRKRVKAAQDGGENAPTMEQVGEEIAKYDAEYVFTMASAGGGRSTLTPLEKEANSLARAWLTSKLKEGGKTYKAYLDEHGKEYVDAKIAEIAATDGIQKKASTNVKAREKAAAETLDVAL